MKKLFLFATAAAVLCSCSNQPKYIIDGDIAGLEGTVYLYPVSYTHLDVYKRQVWYRPAYTKSSA